MSSLSLDSSMPAEALGAVHAACASKVEIRRGGTAISCEVKDKAINEPLAIARLIVRTSSHIELFGANPKERVRVEEMLAVFQAVLLAGNVDDSILVRLNDELEASTCVAGNNVTVADIMLFFAVRTKVIGLVKGPCDHLCHVVRWFDYMQYLPFIATVPVPVRALGVFDVQATTPEVVIRVKESDKSEQKAKQEQKPTEGTKKDSKPEGTKKDNKPEGTKETKEEDKGAKAKKEDKAKKDNVLPTAATKVEEKETKSKGKEVPTAQVLIGRLDVRVGLIKSVSKHPTVDTFYVTEIDIGTGSITVVTGVAAYFTPDQLTNKKVCVIVNLGSSPCKGVDSAGRILCATSADGKTKEILEAPAGAVVGESLTYPGVQNTFDSPISSKNFSKLAKELTTNANRQAVYRDEFLFTSSAGVVTLPTIAGGTVA